ncbi:hypothetical protein L0668_14120 [Paraglaciecola aquimarina]|uniref:Uncharacterized protein n=1 Tax=Paraglaciecola algarum TaxID=3050085 RepID=A0ABS9D8Q3_9ALTE|nr:hypothetical protein [Paraglaciecola sp. G1-23]MCF2949251.1 hypothetical protein [Paraglaciecola sp. G1-23]
MYKFTILLSIFLIGVVHVNQAKALPSKCIQSEERTKACPRLIYKQAAVAVPVLEVKKNDVICLCLTDLALVKNSKMSKLEEIDWQVTMQRIAQKYQISQEELIKLVKH